MACYHVFMAVSILGLFAIGVYEFIQFRKELKESEEESDD
jgi:hypothetical protein